MTCPGTKSQKSESLVLLHATTNAGRKTLTALLKEPTNYSRVNCQYCIPSEPLTDGEMSSSYFFN